MSTQDRIREAAMRLFGVRGYAGTSIADIAQQVGISKAGLYNYYSSKEELLLELMESSFKAWQQASRPALLAPGPCRDRLWEHFRRAVRFATENPAEVAVIRVAATQIDGELGSRVEVRVAEKKDDYIGILETFFTEALERREVRGASSENLARAWKAFLDGLLTDLIFRPPGEAPSTERLAGMWEIVWRGLEGPINGERSPDEDDPIEDRPAKDRPNKDLPLRESA